ncbi:hypothetical protein [Bergeyella zoohelcum]|uniref:Uncharacterized protein n=1 Tax=Bergeyella zoohelcum TaxID=1015 RepID=A0A7Z9CFM0_9FLAO|nr:hypothetical protein [Bergeyella zoohelcum]VDH03468.1 Uncharacterised protein [Bergeyella zoohelcum]
MNKTTIKISVLAFLGFMTYGYAQQQQQDPYKGKVGVNTVTPSATMDVQPNNDNARVEAKTNEGIIAPKLSKTRIANIETPVEGTLVYATDDATSLISAYTGNDPKVAKITEKGYYFYNGTEWVKAGNNGTETEWVYDNNTNRVNLKRSGINTKKVFYNEYGGLRNMDFGMLQSSGNVTLNPDDFTINYFSPYNATIKYSSSVFPSSSSYGNRFMNYSFLNINENDNSSNVYAAGNNTISIGDSSGLSFSQNINRVLGSISSVAALSGQTFVISNHRNTLSTGNESKVSSAFAVENILTHGSTETLGNAIGVRNIQSILDNTTVTNSLAEQNITTVNKGATVTNLLGIRNQITVQDGGANVSNLYGLHNIFNIKTGSTVGNFYGIKLDMDAIGNGTINNTHYGLYIQNVNKAPLRNFSIYTNAGQIRFGDLANTNTANNNAGATDKPVFVTADGVLKVGDSTGATQLSGIDAMPCNDANRGKMNFIKDVQIAGGGTADAFGICLKSSDGNFYWRYLYGGTGVTNLTGNFGENLD